MKRLLLALMLAVPATLSTTAMAQDDVGSLDGPGDEDSSRDKRKQSGPKEVREVTKGFYVKSNVGGALYLGKFSGFVRPGSSVTLAVGQDVLDRETMSGGWEVGFTQGIHNGCNYELQAALACSANQGGTRPSPYVQGDLRTYTLAANGELSFYPVRRFGVGLRAGAGVLFSPLLMDEERYQTEVIQRYFGGVDPGYHGPPKVVVLGGPTFEYYSKLAHFSVGADVDVFYALAFDLGMNITGYFKYTF